jgi:hypothetical protein
MSGCALNAHLLAQPSHKEAKKHDPKNTWGSAQKNEVTVLHKKKHYPKNTTSEVIVFHKKKQAKLQCFKIETRLPKHKWLNLDKKVKLHCFEILQKRGGPMITSTRYQHI